jgi:anti-sigma regulatory factor (Ser/Thr protein kinase)
LLESLIETETTFELQDNDLGLVPVLIGHMLDTADEFGVCTNGDRMHLAVSLEEAITNGIVHGNLEVSSEHRGEDDALYHRLIKERRRQAPYCHRKLRVRGLFRPHKVSFTIADEGPGFDPRALADPTRPENLDKAHGRGLFLIRAFTDEVSFNSRGNEIRLVKRASAKHVAPAIR